MLKFSDVWKIMAHFKSCKLCFLSNLSLCVCFRMGAEKYIVQKKVELIMVGSQVVVDLDAL